MCGSGALTRCGCMWEETITKWHKDTFFGGGGRDTFWVIDMFIILILMVISWYTHTSKLIKLYILIMHSLFVPIISQKAVLNILKNQSFLWTRHCVDSGYTRLSKGDVLFVNINVQSVRGKFWLVLWGGETFCIKFHFVLF